MTFNSCKKKQLQLLLLFLYKPVVVANLVECCFVDVFFKSSQNQYLVTSETGNLGELLRVIALVTIFKMEPV